MSNRRAHRVSDGVCFDGRFYSDDDIGRPSWMDDDEGIQRQNQILEQQELKAKVDEIHGALEELRKPWYKKIFS